MALDNEDRTRELVRGKDATRNVGRWTRHLMGRELEGAGALQEALEVRDAPQWPAFTRELFGELYGLGTKALPEGERAPGSEWIGEVLEQAEQLPEWRELQARSEGDPWRCGLGTASAVRALEDVLADALDQLPDEDPQELQDDADDAAKDAQDAEERARAVPSDDAEKAADDLAQAAKEAQDAADQAKAQGQQVAQAIADADGGAKVRGALRVAAQEAHSELDEMEEAMAGLGHGHGAGALTAVNAPSEQVAEALRGNPELRRIAAIAGRLRMTAKKKQATKVDFGREEICDVEIGSDIQRLLPSELVLLADPELEPLLMRKLVENQAMQYRMRGTERAERGPIVVMMDGSISMKGARHEWAMGVALAMLEVAAMQHRALALVHFGSRVLKSDVVANPRRLTLPKLIEMVTYWGRSGTNIQSSLDWVGEHLLGHEEALKGADVLLVTDGESGDFSAQVKALRESYGAATYGIAIQTDWCAENQEPLEDYHHVTDKQIHGGTEDIGGVLSL